MVYISCRQVADQPNAALFGELEMKLKSLQDKIAMNLATILFNTAVAITTAVLGVWIITLAFSILALLYLWPLHIRFDTLRTIVRSLPKHELLPTLREQQIVCPLANHLLKVAGVPTILPVETMNALNLGERHHTKDGSPLDWPITIFEVPIPNGKTYPWSDGKTMYLWERLDTPTLAFQHEDGTWDRVHGKSTY